MKIIFTLIFSSFLFSNFQLDKSNSNISYTGTHPFHNFQGITSQIEIISKCDAVSLDCKATISVPIISFISGNDNRDSNMLFSVNAFSYPMVKISFNNLNISHLLSTDEKITYSAEIDFHGNKIIQDIPILLNKVGKQISVNSNFTIELDQFKIDPPSLLMLPISNQIHIDVNLKGGFTHR